MMTTPIHQIISIPAITMAATKRGFVRRGKMLVGAFQWRKHRKMVIGAVMIVT